MKKNLEISKTKFTNPKIEPKFIGPHSVWAKNFSSSPKFLEGDILLQKIKVPLHIASSKLKLRLKKNNRKGVRIQFRRSVLSASLVGIIKI